MEGSISTATSSGDQPLALSRTPVNAFDSTFTPGKRSVNMYAFMNVCTPVWSYFPFLIGWCPTYMFVESAKHQLFSLILLHL